MEPDRISSSHPPTHNPLFIDREGFKACKLLLLGSCLTSLRGKIEWKIYTRCMGRELRRGKGKRCLRFSFPFCSFHIQFCVHPVWCCSTFLQPFTWREIFNEKTGVAIQFYLHENCSFGAVLFALICQLILPESQAAAEGLELGGRLSWWCARWMWINIWRGNIKGKHTRRIISSSGIVCIVSLWWEMRHRRQRELFIC